MKLLKVTLGFLLVTIIMSFTYPSSFVEMSSVNYDGWEFKSIILKRQLSGKRIKIKYFAAKENGKNVSNRYEDWAYGKNIIAYTSAAYMTTYDLQTATPKGLSVDNGKVLNRNLAKFDGLVVVYNTGGIVAAHIDEGISVSGIGRKLYVKNTSDKYQFLQWCEQNNATVFQTHLLAFKNELKIGKYNSSSTTRERRFLAVGYNDDDELQYVIVHSPKSTTLYDGTKKVMDYLNNYEDMDNVIFIINLDTGAQNVSRAYNNDGSINKNFEGELNLNKAINLLTFYYQ